MLIPAMRRTGPCEIVILTCLVDPHIAMHAHRLGAYACVHKTAPASELPAGIRSASTSSPAMQEA